MKEFPKIQPCLSGGTLFRIVESQEVVATTKIVDSLAKQERLEALIEASKPTLPEPTRDYGYLLATPFRYPPLQYGSRFGTVHEPSLFYGSKHESTCVAECAFYQFLFFHSMAVPPASNNTVQHTLFTALFRSENTADLSQAPYAQYKSQICHPSDYRFSHQLGHSLRQAGIDCILAPSARDPEHKLNVALFNAKPLLSKKPKTLAEWASLTDGQRIQFKNLRSEGFYEFWFEQFSGSNGNLPFVIRQ